MPLNEVRLREDEGPSFRRDRFASEDVPLGQTERAWKVSQSTRIDKPAVFTQQALAHLRYHPRSILTKWETTLCSVVVPTG